MYSISPPGRMPSRRLGLLRGLIAFLAVGLLAGVWGAPSSAAQVLEFEGGPPDLRVSSFAPGTATAADTDASTTLIIERADTAGPLEIVVDTEVTDRQFDLSVAARDETHGTPREGPIELRDDQAPMEFLRDIEPCDRPAAPPCREQVTLEYRLETSVTDGPGTDYHVVRYTVQAQ